MSLTLPNVTIQGTLTADPELRFTPSGAAVANINIACNTRRKNPNTDQWEDGDTTFLRASIWKGLAENVAESLHRGDKVIAYGQLKQRNFEDKEGNKRTAYELEVEAIGPSLQFATASVQKAQRSGGGNSGGSSGGDAWGSADAEPDW